MNIDRPLDDIVKEARKARTAKRTARNKDAKTAKKSAPANGNNKTPNAAPQSAPSAPSSSNAPSTEARNSPDNKSNLNRRRGAIQKKRRTRRKPNPVAVDVDREGNVRPAKKLPLDHNKPANHNNSISNRLALNAIATKPRAPKGVKVAVSNLHPGVTETDIAELFETVGPLKRAHLFKFNDGESACEAEVVFENMQHALEAIKRYNLVPLDNQPLQITLATDSAPIQANKQRRAPQKKQQAIENNQYDEGTPQQSPDFAQRDQSPLANQNNSAAHGRRAPRRRNRRQYGRIAGAPPSQDRPMYED